MNFSLHPAIDSQPLVMLSKFSSYLSCTGTKESNEISEVLSVVDSLFNYTSITGIIIGND
jgi:hypothetical protein